MRLRTAAAAGSLAVAISGSAHAGHDRWGPSHGPAPGPVVALAVHPTNPLIVYAGTPTVWEGGDVKSHGALYRSTDGGRRWIKAVDDGVTAIASTRPGTVYVATESEGVQKSTDGGRTWLSANRGLGDFTVATLAVDPTRPEMLYAGTGHDYGDGAFKSTNGGRQWRRSGLAPYYVDALVVDPRTPTTIYAAVWDAQLANDPRNRFARSIDGGRTWRVPEYGLRSIWSLAVSGRTSTVFAGTSRGVFKSVDGGGRWTPSGLNGRTGVIDLVVDPRAAETLYAAQYGRGVFRSRDSGRTWTPLNAGLTSLQLRSLAIAANGRLLYAGTDAGVFGYRLR